VHGGEHVVRDDEGNFTDTLVLRTPSGSWLLRVEPESVIEP
jgi:hypothetical protein